jgi:hypothetical protein
MTVYLVKAKPKKNIMKDLHTQLESGHISQLKPFRKALHHGLQNAKIDDNNKDGYAYWVEEDYCSPPLAMEREAVLDKYFDDISVEKVDEAQRGWKRIRSKPLLWQQQ